MKKLVIIMMLLAFVGANVAVAADSYTYENSKGNITFNHKAHQERVGWRLRQMSRRDPGQNRS